MHNELMRKYIDIINENQVQLDEGMLDKIKGLVPKFIKFLGADKYAEIANKVKEITGGDFSTNPENAQKVAQAFGFDKIINDKAMSKENIMSEGLAGNWQGKLVQFLYLLGLGGSAAAAAAVPASRSWTMSIGLILLMVAYTFFSDNKGMVGSMGKRGNVGFETDK